MRQGFELHSYICMNRKILFQKLMKSINKILILMALLCTKVYAQQYVTIMDANFAAYLQQIMPSCMSGNQLNTQCPQAMNLQTLNIANKGISNLGGITGFANLRDLDCSFNSISNIITLPTYLQSLRANDNPIQNIFPLPTYLTELQLSNTGISTMPALPANLRTLNVSNCLVGNMPPLPSTIEYLYMVGTGATVYPPFTSIMKGLAFGGNNLGPLPQLPPNLNFLTANFMQLDSLPALPNSLITLECRLNNITSLPPLPSSLIILNVDNNPLAALPLLPNGISAVSANYTQLTTVPNFPSSLTNAQLKYCQITCLPPFPQPSNLTIDITGNPLTCLPNYAMNMTPAVGTIPICTTGNAFGCVVGEGIGGNVYNDMNGNCVQDSLEAGVGRAPIKLYDNSGTFVQSSSSHASGDYFLSQGLGTWKVEIDTANTPYQVTCVYPGIDSTLTLSSGTPLALDVNFAVECKPGFDVGALTASHLGIIFPGQPFRATLVAGDMSQTYGLNCAAGTAGQVVVTVSGPATYTGIGSGALSPTVSGNTYTYNVADFGTLDIFNDLQLAFTTNTTAVAGDSICFQVNVSPSAGDNVPSNNVGNYCFYVVNSFDPNAKEVSPLVVAPNYTGWLDYTILFQNTGNAAAINIRLEDTLEANLDWATLEFLNASHNEDWHLVGNILTVNFPNIMLPDSASNPAGSQGYFQFRVKPKAGLVAGTEIKNTASIYFDFNAPIVTNEAITTFSTATAVDAHTYAFPSSVFPNPSKGHYNVELPMSNGKAVNWEVRNLLGQVIESGEGRGNFEIDIQNQAAGYYLLRMEMGGKQVTRRLIKQ